MEKLMNTKRAGHTIGAFYYVLSLRGTRRSRGDPFVSEAFIAGEGSVPPAQVDTGSAIILAIKYNL